jgi:hypothetical protein
MMGIMNSRRLAGDNAHRAASILAQLVELLPPEDPIVAVARAINVSAALAHEAELATSVPALSTRICWLAGLCVGLTTIISAATLPWMSYHGMLAKHLALAVQIVRWGLWTTVSLCVAGLLGLILVIRSSGGTDPLLLLAGVIFVIMLCYAATVANVLRSPEVIWV